MMDRSSELADEEIKIPGVRTAIVTGAASGIGLAVVELLARDGVEVALNHLPNDTRGTVEVARLQAEGLSVFSAPGDVSDPNGAEKMMSSAIQRLKRLDYLVNNAGTAATSTPIPLGELDRLDEAFWSTILSTNLVASFRCVKAAAVALKKSGGAVVNTASIGGLDSAGSSIAYSASKAALINLTKNLARALSPLVRVNAVAPGYVESPWTAAWPAEKREAFIRASLLERACTPVDVAEVIVFLCTRGAMITGQTIVVDGGFMLGR
jgi:3-oxoacyl-[acyl-carrier protein] reductase